MAILTGKGGQRHSSNVKTIYCCAIIYKLMLDFTYIAASEIYSYRGIALDFNVIKYIFSWLYLLILVPFVFQKKESIGAMIMQMLFIMLVIPVLTVYAMKNRSHIFVIMLLVCFLIQCVLVNCSPQTGGAIRIKQGRIFLHVVLIAITIVTYGVLLMKNRPSLAGLKFDEAMYAIRDNVDYGFSLIRYTSAWQFRVINPYYIIYGLKKKNYKLVFLFCVLQVLIFLILARKEILFGPFLVLGIYIIQQKFDFSSIFFAGLSGLTFVCYAILKVTSWRMPFATVPIRLLFDPAQIDFMFYEQFSTNLPKLLYSESHLGKLFGISYPYNKPSGWVVNNIYFPTIEAEANTGYLSYSYANAGFLGMLLASILMVLILRLLDKVTDNKLVAFAFCAYAFSILVNGALLATLLTGGILLIIIIFSFDEDVFRTKELANELDKKKRCYKFRI